MEKGGGLPWIRYPEKRRAFKSALTRGQFNSSLFRYGKDPAMRPNYHPNPAINRGFQYQQELQSHLHQLQRNPHNEGHLEAFMESLYQFLQALRSGSAVVPGERIHSPVLKQSLGRCA